MVKRIISEDERQRRAEYQRLYRARRRQDRDWMEAEADRKRRYYVPKRRKTAQELRHYNNKYKMLMRTRRATAKIAARNQAQPVRRSRRARQEPPEGLGDEAEPVQQDAEPGPGPSREFRGPSRREKKTPQRIKYVRHRGRLMKLTKQQMLALSTSSDEN